MTSNVRSQMRNSNIELLRIIAMLIIVIHHFGNLGVFHLTDPSRNLLYAGNLSYQIIGTQLVCWGGILGNSIFILITGYYLIKGHVNIKKIFLLLLAMFFYSWCIEGIAYGIFTLPHTMKDVIEQSIPIWFGKNWFVSCYIIFSFFIPFINESLTLISKETYKRFLILMYIFYVCIPCFLGNTFMNRSNFIFFCFVYAIGGYIRLYGREFLFLPRFHKSICKIGIILLAIILLSILFFDIAGTLLNINLLIRYGTHLLVILLSIPLAVCIFIYFLARKKFYSRVLNVLGSATLGVYLIHENDLMRIIIWDKIFPNVDFLHSDWYFLFYLLKVFTIFILFSFIDVLRKKYLESYVSRWLSKVLKNIDLQKVWLKLTQS